MSTPGDPAPWFTARSSVNERYAFDTAGGRAVRRPVLPRLAAADPAARRVLDDFWQVRDGFDVANAVFFGVSTDPADEKQPGRVPRDDEQAPGVLYFWDSDRAISRLYGVAPPDAAQQSPQYQRQTVVLPPLRVVAVFPFDPEPAAHVARVIGSGPRCRG